MSRVRLINSHNSKTWFCHREIKLSNRAQPCICTGAQPQDSGSTAEVDPHPTYTTPLQSTVELEWNSGLPAAAASLFCFFPKFEGALTFHSCPCFVYFKYSSCDSWLKRPNSSRIIFLFSATSTMVEVALNEQLNIRISSKSYIYHKNCMVRG